MSVARSTCRKVFALSCITSAAFCALSVFCAQEAEAQVNIGAEAGLAYRSSSPSLQLGQAVGAHAEVKIVPLLSVGGYYLYQQLGQEDAGDNAQPAAFRTFGGRARLSMPMPGSNFRPYSFIGVGYTDVEYPSTATIGNINAAAVNTTNIVNRSGSYVETPIGVGCGYQLSIIQLSLDLAFRPGFAFSGNAYDGATAFDKPQIGFSSMLGLSLDI